MYAIQNRLLKRCQPGMEPTGYNSSKRSARFEVSKFRLHPKFFGKRLTCVHLLSEFLRWLRQTHVQLTFRLAFQALAAGDVYPRRESSAF
jgi:hypothetical protein